MKESEGPKEAAKAATNLEKEKTMNPLWLIAVPIVLLITGMILNGRGSSQAYPETSLEQDPTKRLAAEKEAYRKLSDLHRERFLKKQKRVYQFAWLVLIAFIASTGWLYIDTVIKTTASKQIAAIQTVAAAEGKEMVLSVTLNDGNVAKYLVKAAAADASNGAVKDARSEQSIGSWELSRLETALSSGTNALPLGIDLKIDR